MKHFNYWLQADSLLNIPILFHLILLLLHDFHSEMLLKTFVDDC